MQKKTGFLLYQEQYEQIKKLSVEEKANLLDMIYEYNTSGIFGIPISQSVDIVFGFMKIQFDINYKKWENVCVRNRYNIAKRRDKNTTGKIGIPKDTKNTDTDTDTDTENENEIQNFSEEQKKEIKEKMQKFRKKVKL